MFSDELKNEPNDPSVSIKLLEFYIYNGRLHEAYDQAFETKLNFVPNLFWYQSCLQLCKVKYRYLIDLSFACKQRLLSNME